MIVGSGTAHNIYKTMSRDSDTSVPVKSGQDCEDKKQYGTLTFDINVPLWDWVYLNARPLSVIGCWDTFFFCALCKGCLCITQMLIPILAQSQVQSRSWWCSFFLDQHLPAYFVNILLHHLLNGLINSRQPVSEQERRGRTPRQTQELWERIRCAWGWGSFMQEVRHTGAY